MEEKPTDERRRVVTWEDPMLGAKAARSMPGLDFLRAMAAGDVPAPPIARLLGMGLAESAKGRVVFTGEPAEYHYNPIGTVHGGFAATLFDSALGCAIHTALPEGMGYTTLELKVSYFRPLTKRTGTVRCVAEVLHIGSRAATAEAKLLDENDKICAHATTTCLVFRLPGRSEESS